MSNTSSRNPPRLLRVRRTEQLTPHMRRVWLSGDALSGFPTGSEGRHIKLMLARSGQAEPVLPTLGPDGPIWPPADVRPITRTYTVAAYDEAAGELAVDLVLHGDNGPASRWINHAMEGDAIGVAGPAAPPLFRETADWYLLIGDPSSIPLLRAVLCALPAQAKGMALIEVPDQAEIQPLIGPAGVTIEWFDRQGAPAGDSTLLLDSLQRRQLPDGQPSVTLAGESNQVVAIRDWLLKVCQVSRHMMYAVPYWKDRLTEEAYHHERHRIMDELEETTASDA
ncbi:siderophore-interacting protein [Chitinivorax sp. B]|uniref:siderophore-interacting protein n=1 Tax=Chitinivorax sp. B TaxID=2502235 RepID=UPI0010FA52F2|nr:siderophore-interacting protein [Chitinivorax sp. B]